MLQPLQLEEVSARYSTEIAELRGFFSKARLPVGTAGALHAVAQRLQQDRAFHRDLTSHLWVLIEETRGPENMTQGTVLGILAAAAAGPRLAAEAGTDDAHDLLRFVMAARRSLGATTPSDSVERPEQSPATEVAPSENLPLRTKFVPAETTPTRVAGRSKTWAVAALAGLLLAGAGIWIGLRPSSQVSVVPATIVATPSTVEPPASTQVEASLQSEPERPSARSSRAQTVPLRRSVPASVPDANPSEPTTPVQRDSRSMDAGQKTVVPASQVPQQMSVVAPSAARPASRNVPVPASTLSKRLGSPAMPAYAPAEDEAVTRRHPRLLRRVPDTTPLRDPDDTLLAEAAPADAPSIPSSGRANATIAVHPAGTVRPASLGNMAANVVYTPVPPYPAAASAAGVQGEVRVQARIDPSGNVASARVISGPPLLRDAALNAVQHWRYKPWTASGRPTATSTVAVVDFELP